MYSLTGFSLLDTLYTADGVTVCVWLGIGAFVVKMLHALVGYNRAVFVAVTVLPGLPCIGAYLINPVCRENAITDPEGTLDAAAPAAAPATFAGTAVLPWAAACLAAVSMAVLANAPDIPDIMKR